MNSKSLTPFVLVVALLVGPAWLHVPLVVAAPPPRVTSTPTVASANEPADQHQPC